MPPLPRSSCVAGRERDADRAAAPRDSGLRADRAGTLLDTSSRSRRYERSRTTAPARASILDARRSRERSRWSRDTSVRVVRRGSSRSSEGRPSPKRDALAAAAADGFRRLRFPLLEASDAARLPTNLHEALASSTAHCGAAYDVRRLEQVLAHQSWCLRQTPPARRSRVTHAFGARTRDRDAGRPRSIEPRDRRRARDQLQDGREAPGLGLSKARRHLTSPTHRLRLTKGAFHTRLCSHA